MEAAEQTRQQRVDKRVLCRRATANADTTLHRPGQPYLLNKVVKKGSESGHTDGLVFNDSRKPFQPVHNLPFVARLPNLVAVIDDLQGTYRKMG